MVYSTRKKLCVSASAPSLTMALVTRSRSRLSKSSEIHRSATATFGKAIGKSKSSVKRYVAGLVEKGLITVEPTSVIMRNGLKKNGNLRYHIRPIREAVEWHTQHQLYLAEAAAERQRVQRKLSAQATEPPCSPL